MTVVSLKAGTGVESIPSVLRIGLSDGSLFSFKLPYLPVEFQDESVFSPGKDLSAAEEDACRFAAACYRTERAALRLVARAEQTCRGITHKLEIRGFAASCIQAVVSYLADLEIINDERYAVLWLHARLARSVEAPRKLLAGLHRRGISSRIAEGALKSVLDFQTESALLKGYLKKKHPHNPETDKYLKKQLKYEGFSPSVIENVWEEDEI
ncbi:MAG: RecX family transcriptional regulator [Spirochaetaceae bacterium]|jgi:regulatory protein|nr:RecX family transcriptional regulator [Spirochaetaceae bacterium]